MRMLFVVSSLAFAGFTANTVAQENIETRTETNPTRLVYQLEPFVDLYFLVRSEAGRNEPSGLPAEFNDTIAACKKIQDKLGRGTLNWETLEQHLLGVKTPANSTGGIVHARVAMP